MEVAGVTQGLFHPGQQLASFDAFPMPHHVECVATFEPVEKAADLAFLRVCIMPLHASRAISDAYLTRLTHI